MNHRYLMYSLCILLQSFVGVRAQCPRGTLKVLVEVESKYSHEKLGYAFVALSNNKCSFQVQTSSKGVAHFTSVMKGAYKLSTSYLGHKGNTKDVFISNDTLFTLSLTPVVNSLQEVVVTASESKGLTSASKIDSKAMKHLQPSSFSDILQMLPGGISSNPQMGSVNLAKIRQAGSMGSDYDISSLGTSFVVDGVPINTNANMQYVAGTDAGSSDAKRQSVNRGVDMRTLSTDNIESVEIVRGIPSVEYGDLTSGLIKIKRKQSATPLEARLKADEYGKLFYVGKGISLQDNQLTINAGLDYLDSKKDPRNNFENYKRLTASLRALKIWQDENYKLAYQPSLDYTNSFDDVKIDPDISYQKIDQYRSTYNKISLAQHLDWTFKKSCLMKSLTLDAAFSMQLDKIEQTKFISLNRDIPIYATNDEGEHDGVYLPYKYIAHAEVDGKPLNAFVKAKGNFAYRLFNTSHRMKTGVEWTWSKNVGKGQIYDLSRPLSIGLGMRPRSYNEIPAQEMISAFVEDEVKYKALKIAVGVRGLSLLNLDNKYQMKGRIFLDPRLNMEWKMPTINIASQSLLSSIFLGVGWHTKTPTLLHLYPDKYYNDIAQLNYYHLNPAYRRLNLRTYILDRTNYQLKPAVNKKWEIRADFSYTKNRLSVTYFREKMSSGFRSSATYLPFPYKRYDANAIHPNTLQAPPDVTTLPFVTDTILGGYSIATNGSKMIKEGVELQFSSKRLERLHTRITINGAWFRTTYVDSQPVYKSVPQVVDNLQVSDKFIGLYMRNEGTVNQHISSSCMFDTDLPKLGLNISIDAQCVWMTQSETYPKNSAPIAYMDVHGITHQYTDTDKQNKFLQWLNIRESGSKNFQPLIGALNFKATKDFGRFLTFALFVNKIIDYSPDYQSNGITVRRSQVPYFGMELNFKL